VRRRFGLRNVAAFQGVLSNFTGGSPMSEGDAGDPLQALGRRLDAARRNRGDKAPDDRASDEATAEGRKALAIGLRLGLDLVVAVCVGAALGWAFDNWLGTRPWGMIGFLFLGFAAGLTTVFRAALRMERAVGFGAPPPQGAQSDDEE
jgi:ATP synthase protein I